MVVSAQRQPCGVVGTDTGELVPNRNRGFYLNTQNPAPCNGTVNSFQYCYYHTDRLFTFNIDSYDFTFAVFRETSPGSRTYSAVSDVFTTGRTDLDSRNFACQKYQAINPVQIEAGDVIGACIYNPPEEGIFSRRVELVIVGQTASADQYLMMTDGSGCGDFTVPNYFSISSLNKLNSNVLHVSGSISKLPPWYIHTYMYIYVYSKVQRRRKMFYSGWGANNSNFERTFSCSVDQF